MRNIEIKARARDWTRIEAELARLEARDAGIETQHDIFYACERGRLKLRVSSRDGAALIHYERSDAASVRPSDYSLLPVADAEALRRLLDDALGRRGEVRKRRHLYLVDNVRVHLDEVDGLGRFLELEAVVGPEHPEAQCRERAAELLERFVIAPEDQLSVAYLDLLRH
jgi:predicted adenylyl cyclase CyaB